MYTFTIRPEIKVAHSFQEFTEMEPLQEKDLILTNQFIYEPFIKPCGIKSRVLIQEKYGKGEPDDEMIDAIRKDIPEEISRIIAVGGGTVIDIAKVLTFQGEWLTEDLFLGKLIPEKVRELTVIPTTCGTGSEMTNITICELKNLKTKKGLALDSMYPDDTVLIPEMLRTLPYHFFATSSIDAMIHAVESYVSPKAASHSEIYSEKALELILEGYRYIEKHGREAWRDRAEDFLIASNFAGIAFGFAGCGAVHAMSYPLGGIYHIPHGEANQLMFQEVFKKYREKKPEGKLQQLEELVERILKVQPEQGFERLFGLMDFVLERKPLREYGVEKEKIPEFCSSVIAGQQRLLNNNYTEITESEMAELYESCW